MERCRSDSPVVGPDLVVERQKVRGDLLSDPISLGDDAPLLGLDVGQLVANAGGEVGPLLLEGIALSRQLGHRSTRALDPLHDLQLDVLEVGLTPDEVLELGRDGLELLGITDRAGVQELLIPTASLPHLLDITIRLLLLDLEITGDCLSGHHLVARSDETRLDLRKRRSVGQVRSLVRELRHAGVLLLEVEQAQLDGGVGVQDGLPRCRVHGSVTIRDTWTSTVVPRASTSDRSDSAAIGSQGHSLAQCATSTRAHPPSTRWSWAR